MLRNDDGRGRRIIIVIRSSIILISRIRMIIAVVTVVVSIIRIMRWERVIIINVAIQRVEI